MTLDKNNHNLQGLYNNEAIFSLDNAAAQKCICDAVRENHIDLMLLTDPNYGKRNQEEIVFTVGKALFDNENLRTEMFPDWVLSMEDVVKYLKRNEVQPKLINEYIQLTITFLLQSQSKQNKQNKPFLFNYIANRLSKIIAARVAEFAVLIRTKDQDLGQESLKIKKKLLEDIEWEPSLSAYIYDYLLTLPCVKLFKQFVAQSGVEDVSIKLVEMIYEAFEYVEIKRDRKLFFGTLDSIRSAKKKPEKLDLGPTFYHKKTIQFTALGDHLGQKKNAPDSDESLHDVPAPNTNQDIQKPQETGNGRKRQPTLRGIGRLDYSVTELTEDELFEVKPAEDGQPLPAVIEAGDEDWEEKTKPQRGSINRNGSFSSSSKAIGEIHSKPAEVALPALPSVTEIPAITKAAEEKPIPAVSQIPEKIEDIALPELASIKVEPAEKITIKEKIANIQGTVKNNPLIIVAGTLAAFASVLGTYVLTRPAQQAQEQQKKKTHLVESRQDAGFQEAMRAVVMHDASVSADAMRAVLPPEVMQADMDFIAVKPIKPLIAPKIKTEPKQPKQYKPAQTIVKKIDLSPKADDSVNISPVSLSSIRNIPDGTYKNMLAGESYVVEKASEGSITGFMQDALLEMARKSPNKKESVKAYYKMLAELERGWLLYMQLAEGNLKGKEKLSERESKQLEYWANYKKSHKVRGYDAKYLLNRYKKLKEGSGEYKYYKNLLDKASALMNGLEELNPHILDVNTPGNQKVIYAKDGQSGKVYVLKTFMDFASGMNLPVPAKFTGTTGEITPAKATQPAHTFAEQAKDIDKEKSGDSLSGINKLIEKLEKNAAERDAKEQAQKDSTMNLLDRIVNSVEENAAKRETEKTANQERTDKFLDKMLAQIEENNHQRDLEKRNNWVVGETSRSSGGTIENVSQHAILKPAEETVPTVVLNDIAPQEQSGTITSGNNLSRTQSGVIEKPVKSSGEIITSESKDRLSKSSSGEIEKPKKSFFAGVKQKAKSLWGKLFG